MEPYDPNASIADLLVMARAWARIKADEHAEKQESLTTAAVIAETQFRATPELSKNSFDTLCKKFKAQYAKCEEQGWYITFKAEFNTIYHDRRVTQAKAEEERRERARIRGEARIAHLQGKIEKSKKEESETYDEFFALPTRQPEKASSTRDHQGASLAEPADSGEVSRARCWGETIPETPQQTTKCVVCDDKVHERSVCAFCLRHYCERHMYETRCCNSWKCSVYGKDCCQCNCDHPAPPPLTAVYAVPASPKEEEEDDEQMENQSLLPEVTPSPIPEEDQEGTIPITFTSVEDLR